MWVWVHVSRHYVHICYVSMYVPLCIMYIDLYMPCVFVCVCALIYVLVCV